MTRAAIYVRTDPEDTLPIAGEQREELQAFASENGYQVVEIYEDLDASGAFLYHKPGLKAAIHNIKEQEDWEVLLVAAPRCVSDNESALHELVHKLSLYGNRLESPGRPWDEYLAAMKRYRREMSRR